MSVFSFEDSQPISTAALDPWLQKHVPDFKGPCSVIQFGGGQSNPTYRIDARSGSYVLRTKPGPVAKLLPSAHAIEREFAVMCALGRTDVPVPKVYGLCEDEEIIGRAFYVMEYLSGRVFWDPSLPGLSSTERAVIFDEMNTILGKLHTVAFGDIGLADYGRFGNYFERQISRWSRQYKFSADGAGALTKPIEEMERLVDWLPSNIPPAARGDRMVSIVHGDFRMDNLMFHPTELRVIAVLDWELSTLGHPLADLSYHCMAWHVPHGVLRGIGGLNLQDLGIPSEQGYITRYCRRTGFTTPEALAPDWNFYVAYNLFRLAAILQGIAKRIESGTASKPITSTPSQEAKTLAQKAWSLIR